MSKTAQELRDDLVAPHDEVDSNPEMSLQEMIDQLTKRVRQMENPAKGLRLFVEVDAKPMLGEKTTPEADAVHHAEKFDTTHSWDMPGWVPPAPESAS